MTTAPLSPSSCKGLVPLRTRPPHTAVPCRFANPPTSTKSFFMPHLTIEYSANLPHYPEAETLTALNASLCAHPQVQDEADLKTRFIVADSFEIGTAPAQRAFVHAQLRLLSGRTPEVKKELSDRIAQVLRERTPRPQGVMVQLSVEVVDMDRGSYAKERL